MGSCFRDPVQVLDKYCALTHRDRRYAIPQKRAKRQVADDVTLLEGRGMKV